MSLDIFRVSGRVIVTVSKQGRDSMRMIPQRCVAALFDLVLESWWWRPRGTKNARRGYSWLPLLDRIFNNSLQPAHRHAQPEYSTAHSTQVRSKFINTCRLLPIRRLCREGVARNATWKQLIPQRPHHSFKHLRVRQRC